MTKDAVITKRVAEELFRLPGTNREIARKIGCHPDTIVAWETGRITPNAHSLAAMHRVGCDVMYILTGERTKYET